MAQVVLEHGGAGGHPQGHALYNLGGDTGAQRAPGAHKAVHIGGQLGQQQVKALQPGCGAHEVAVVKGKHDGIAALGVEDVGHMLLHAPVQAVDALEEKALLIGEGDVYVVVLGHLQTF